MFPTNSNFPTKTVLLTMMSLTSDFSCFCYVPRSPFAAFIVMLGYGISKQELHLVDPTKVLGFQLKFPEIATKNM